MKPKKDMIFAKISKEANTKMPRISQTERKKSGL